MSVEFLFLGFFLLKEEMMKANDVKKGDTVDWNSQQGHIKGQVVKKMTKNDTISVGEGKKRKVKASSAAPQILVKSAKTGKQAIHKPESLKKSKP